MSEYIMFGSKVLWILVLMMFSLKYVLWFFKRPEAENILKSEASIVWSSGCMFLVSIILGINVFAEDSATAITQTPAPIFLSVVWGSYLTYWLSVILSKIRSKIPEVRNT